MLVIIVLAISWDAFTALFLNHFLKSADFKIVFVNLMAITVGVSLFAIAGAFIGQQFDFIFTEMGKAKSIVIFSFLGLKMIGKSMKTRFDEMNFDLNHPKTIFFFTIALSMNAFILGLALPAFNISILQVFVSFLLVFLFSTTAAIFTGRITNNFKIAMRFEFTGGIILIGSAVYYLIKLF